eukprot:112575-Amphidinium_carterae.2
MAGVWMERLQSYQQKVVEWVLHSLRAARIQLFLLLTDSEPSVESLAQMSTSRLKACADK